MKIRAHHLLCIQGFQGYGYSEEFTENMSKVIQNLKSFPDHKIQITTCCDVLCACCPHNIGNKCAESSNSNEKMIEPSENQDFSGLRKYNFRCLKNEVSQPQKPSVFACPQHEVFEGRESEIRRMDIKVLKTIGLQANTIIEAHDAFQLVNKYFKSSNINEICGNCKWKDKCLFFLMKI